MIATVDTNVLVSATLFGGVPGRLLEAAIDRRFGLALSPAILREYHSVLLRPKFGLDADAVAVLVRDLESHGLMVYPTKHYEIVVDDPDDNAVIDCAIEAHADMIVSGDRHLTVLTEVVGIPVLTPARFVELLR